MITPEERQSILDEEHLSLLSIGYYIVGGTHILFGFIPLFCVGMGALFIQGLEGAGSGDELDPAFVGWFLVVVGSVVSLVLFVLGALQLVTGKSLKRREARSLCLFTAAITCLSIPLGTALGVFTFIVLRRQSVEMLFDPMYISHMRPLPAIPAPSPDSPGVISHE